MVATYNFGSVYMILFTQYMIICILNTPLGLYMIYKNYEHRLFMKRDLFTLCNMYI